MPVSLFFIIFKKQRYFSCTNVIYKLPLLEDTYRTSQELWKNLTKEKPKQVFNSRDEFLRANCPFTDDELCEIAEADSKMYN